MRPAIVHTRNLAALETVPAAWLAGVPSRIHGEHGRDADDPDGTNVRRQRIRKVFRPFVTQYVALAPDLARYLRGPIGVADDRIEQIWNGVDTERFAPPAARERIAGCPFGAPHEQLVGTVGRLDPVKDQATLARAFVHALAQSPGRRASMRLVIVGEGGERARIEAILAEGGVRDLAWLAGERHDIPAILRGLDVFVLPSFGEGVSNTILEAMSSGLPVVATRVGANHELVEDGVTGRVVAASDAAALAAAIASYADDPALARQHGDGRAPTHRGAVRPRPHDRSLPPAVPGATRARGRHGACRERSQGRRPAPCAASPESSTLAANGPWTAPCSSG